MKLPSIKKIMREDLKEAPSWVDGLINPLNSFMEACYLTLNRNVTFGENIASFYKELSYTTDASYPGTPHEPVTFLAGLKTKARTVLVVQAYDKATYEPAPGPVYVPWIEENGSIVVGSITGLEASKTYLVRLLIF